MKKENECINESKETLTAEKLRTLINSEMSDHEANEMLLSIKKLVTILIDYQYENELKQQRSIDDNLNQAA